MLLENIAAIAVKSPLKLASNIGKLRQGKAAFKAALAGSFKFDPAILPYNTALLDLLQDQKDRDIFLCTASDSVIAEKIAAHLGIFSAIMASDGVVNLSNQAKADALSARFGKGGFDYVGNSADDLPVWAAADKAWVVNASQRTLAAAQASSTVDVVLPAQSGGIKTWLKALRVHQWVKNILVFLPLMAAHEVANLGMILVAIAGFLAFSFTASGVYLVNDLMDLGADRNHTSKRLRAFAAGKISLTRGVAAAVLLFCAGLSLGTLLPGQFLGWLLTYAVLTTAYSFWLKRLVLMDCFALAGLYTIRIMAGGELLAQSLSLWLICIALFTFISLAFVKRYAELIQHQGTGRDQIKGRGYFVSDAPIVMALGVASGYASAVIMGLYINSQAVRQMYQSPEIVALTIPVLCFWHSWIWLKSARGEMNEDPVMFAVKDRLSLACGAVFAAILIAAAVI